MLDFIKRLKGIDTLSNTNKEEGFTLAEVVIGMVLGGIVMTMGMSLLMNTLHLQKSFMEDGVRVEFGQATLSISSNRLINLNADEAQMKKMWHFTSNMETIYYYSGGAQDWELYGVNDLYGKCYHASVLDSFGSEINCDLIPPEMK